MSHLLESMRLGIDTEPTGIQAAARLQGEQNKKIAELILAAVTAAGHMKILEDLVWDYSRNIDAVWESEKARQALLAAVQELGK